jgi:thiol:disulfide interchange protein DsbD
MSTALAPAAVSPSVRSQHTEATLISDYVCLQPDQQWFSVFLRLKMDPHWHTYWVNPGDSGLPTRITWTLPDGFIADAITWPAPQLISVPPLMSYGYENEVWLAIDIHTPGNFKVGQKIPVHAHVTWLECSDVCMPAKADLDLEFPVAAKSRMVSDPKLSAQISAAAKSAFHFDQPNQRNEATYDAKFIHFLVKDFWGAEGDNTSAAPHPWDALQGARFIPVENGWIEDASTPTFTRKGHDLVIHVPRNPNAPSLPGVYEGILRFEFKDSTKAWTQDVYSTGPLQPESVAKQPSDVSGGGSMMITLLLALVSAFGGGLILNLMPCVLPVLSLKVLAMIEQSKKDNRSSLTHGLAFTAGVLATFWILAGVLWGLQNAGQHLGWGFQLQNPTVVVLLAVLFFGIALNLFGVFEIGTSLTSVHLEGTGLAQSFFSGLLATVVATPCTAPFMGSALGFAFSQPGWVAGLVFTSLGLGMAAPYLVLSASPGLLRFVPKPGAWMETFKQLMGFPMLASVIWLIWVFSHQAGLDATISLLMGLLLMGLAGWLYGRFGTIERPTGTRVVAAGVAACLVIAGLAISVPPKPEVGGVVAAINWEKFDPTRLQQLREAGTPVFVDFTATWCLTCQVNKRVALNVGDVQAKFHEKGVVLMEADWTNQDTVISQALHEFGRNSVPVYLLYGKDKDAPPQILPEILTPDIVLQALDKIN